VSEIQRSGDADDRLLTLNHEIRRTESFLKIAQSRRRKSNFSFVFGPPLLVVLYGLWWVPSISHRLLIITYIPAGIFGVLSLVATVKLKVTPGGPPVGDFEWFKFRNRTSEYNLELQLARERDVRKKLAADVDTPTRVRRMAYKEDAYSDIDKFRTESTYYRSWNNILQGILIIGSLAATGLAALTSAVPDIRWGTLGVTFIVGIASGFMGYFKYKERSFYLQQTADAIESEWEAVEVGIGRYKGFDTEDERLAEFVEEVHRLKSEQKKRQQNLEQPPELRSSHEQ
jgi:hypothetical protein